MRNLLVPCVLVAFPLLAVAAQDPSAIPQSGRAPSADPAYFPGNPSAPPALTLHSDEEKPPKVHKWTGILVDSTCMAAALRRVPSVEQLVYPEPLAEYYLQVMESSAYPSPGKGPGAPATPVPPQSPGQPTGSPASNGEPQTSEHELAMQAAQLKRADLVEQQVNLCTPNKPTSHFGLVVSGDHLLKFDLAGDVKAMKALKTSIVRPGKPVKAKVAGAIVRGDDTVSVASIEIKGPVQSSQELFESNFAMRTMANAVLAPGAGT